MCTVLGVQREALYITNHCMLLPVHGDPQMMRPQSQAQNKKISMHVPSLVVIHLKLLLRQLCICVVHGRGHK